MKSKAKPVKVKGLLLPVQLSDGSLYVKRMLRLHVFYADSSLVKKYLSFTFLLLKVLFSHVRTNVCVFIFEPHDFSTC